MRISIKDLKNQVASLNTLLNHAVEQYTQDKKTGKYKANALTYHLDQAYGGVKLVQFGETGTGVRDISKDGFGTKRELYNFLRAFIAGIEVTRGNK